jgi:hypothetical protein
MKPGTRRIAIKNLYLVSLLRWQTITERINRGITMWEYQCLGKSRDKHAVPYTVLAYQQQDQ